MAGLAALALSACAPTREPLRILVPNAPGGGYDTTARILAGVVGPEAGPSVEVFNLVGGPASPGLGRLREERGNPDLVMMMGLGIVGAASTARNGHQLAEVTPIARLIQEPEIVLVRSDSKLSDFASLRAAWTVAPGKVRVGGGSAPGGPDHLATQDLARALHIPAAQVDYRAYDGGGPLLEALLNGTVDIVVSGVLESADQIREGAARALAVTSRQRVPGLDVPTLRECGVDVVFENWRGVVAPPDLDTAQRDRLVSLLKAAVRSPAWRASAARNGWTSSWLAGDAFGDFLEQQARRTDRLLGRDGAVSAGS